MGNHDTVPGRAPVHVFHSADAWVEGAAVRQLEQVAALDGVKAVAAMPDLHPGKWGPVGCSILSARIHPEIVGSDIGCGMGLFALDLPVRKFDAVKAASRLGALDGAWDGDVSAEVATAGLAASSFDAALGTIGGGNHFCELQAIEDIALPEVAAAAGLDRRSVFALVHSGSRGLGHDVLVRHLAAGGGALAIDAEAGRDYVAAHDRAVAFARLNRGLIARRAAEALRVDAAGLVDVPHNLVEATGAGQLHRKGTAAADRGLVPIPGSRGTLSYLVEPLAAGRAETLASLAHGAGRKWDRGAMHGRVGASRSDREAMARNPFGGVVVCADRDLLVEEAPEAYKAIDRVIADLVAFGLARVVATFRPLVTFKTGAGAREAPDVRRARERERAHEWRRRRDVRRDREGGR
jgi:release factor H-coupled RctB family protein